MIALYQVHPKYGERDCTVNRLSGSDIDAIVKAWQDNGTLVSRDGHMYCYRKPVGENKHPQVTIPAHVRSRLSVPVATSQCKQLVHLVYWRKVNHYAKVPDILHLSHRSANEYNVLCVAESRDLNESRKACHIFAWQCPHTYAPCIHE